MSDKLRKRIKGHYCVYCGEVATSDEHFPPRDYGNLGFILPACQECNSLAGTFHPNNFDKRCDLVTASLKDRYRSDVKRNPLSIDLLLELEKNEWENTLILEQQRRRALDRIAWSAISYLSNIDHNILTALKNVKTHSITEREPKRSKNFVPRRSDAGTIILDPALIKL